MSELNRMVKAAQVAKENYEAGVANDIPAYDLETLRLEYNRRYDELKAFTGWDTSTMNWRLLVG